jgi:hypothetical protein
MVTGAAAKRHSLTHGAFPASSQLILGFGPKRRKRFALQVSAFGTKRTFRECVPMSAFGGKADIGKGAAQQ